MSHAAVLGYREDERLTAFHEGVAVFSDARGRRHLLTMLTRLAQRRPHTEVWLDQAFRDHLEKLAVLALEVAIETGDPVGRVLAKRLVPSPTPLLDGAVVTITPYLLLQPDKKEWLAYFERTLPKVSAKDDRRAYESLMKHGLSRHYWNEFVFEAYVNHEPQVIYLAGLPDIDASRPHSRVNDGRDTVS